MFPPGGSYGIVRKVAMLNRKLVAKAARELKKTSSPSAEAELEASAYFVAASLRLEGIASSSESVMESVQTGRYQPVGAAATGSYRSRSASLR
jgi:hypothetical protein